MSQSLKEFIEEKIKENEQLLIALRDVVITVEDNQRTLIETLNNLNKQ